MVAQTTSTLPPAPGAAPPSRFFLQEGSPDDLRLLRLIEEADAARQDLDRRIRSVQATLAGLQRDLEAARTRLAAVEADEHTLAGEVTKAREAGKRAREDLARGAVAAYTGEPTGGSKYLNVILALPETRDIGRAGPYLQASFGSIADLSKRYGARQQELERLRRTAADTRRAALSHRENLEQREQALGTKRREMSALSQQLAEQLSKEQELRRRVFANREEFERRMAVLAEESTALTARLKTGHPDLASAAPGKGFLSAPLPGAPATSPFGPRLHPIFGDTRQHNGIDLGAPEGAPIAAAADGRVVSAGPVAGYGNLTVVQHANALATLYAHQSSILVEPGQAVRSGDVIGLVGCTGYCTGPHLHFEVRVDGTPVDPQAWF